MNVSSKCHISSGWIDCAPYRINPNYIKMKIKSCKLCNKILYKVFYQVEENIIHLAIKRQ